MIKIRLSLGLILLAALLDSCASVKGPTPTGLSAAATQPSTVILPTTTVNPPTLEPPTEMAAATEALAPTALPVATSRGPNLEATDPTTVSLASGGLQFVEFFRFTWSTCRAMAPMVHGLEAKYFGKIKFSYLDADDPNTSNFQKTLGFYYQPEVYLLDTNGTILQKWVGYTTQEEFEAVFAQYVQ